MLISGQGCSTPLNRMQGKIMVRTFLKKGRLYTGISFSIGICIMIGLVEKGVYSLFALQSKTKI